MISAMLPALAERLRSYENVQGTMTYRLALGHSGNVESVTTLEDNLVTPSVGYGASQEVASVKKILQQTMSQLTFPSGNSFVIVPVLVPIPDLRPIEVAVPHGSRRAVLQHWAAQRLKEGALHSV